MYDHFKTYWSGATVAWSITAKVKPNAPLIILQLGTLTRTSPITQMLNGIAFTAYPSRVALQVDLFTGGTFIAEEGYYENSATNDLLNFINFLESPASVEWSTKNNISVSLLNGVQDLSEIINDSQWQYRAMAELDISFMQWAAEYHGILNESSIIFSEDGIPIGINRENWKQSASGGGTKKLADESTGYFEEVKLERTEEAK